VSTLAGEPQTNNQTVDLTVNAPTGWIADGYSNEFIVEAPMWFDPTTGASGQSNLPNFVSEKWEYASVGVGSNINWLNAWPNTPYALKHGSKVYAQPGPLYAQGSFTDNYDACS
jgi:hypothetical protein